MKAKVNVNKLANSSGWQTVVNAAQQGYYKLCRFSGCRPDRSLIKSWQRHGEWLIEALKQIKLIPQVELTYSLTLTVYSCSTGKQSSVPPTSAHLSRSVYNSISTCCYYFSWGLGCLGMPPVGKYDTLGRSDDRRTLKWKHTEIYLSVHESVLWGLLRSVLK